MTEKCRGEVIVRIGKQKKVFWSFFSKKDYLPLPPDKPGAASGVADIVIPAFGIGQIAPLMTEANIFAPVPVIAASPLRAMIGAQAEVAL